MKRIALTLLGLFFCNPLLAEYYQQPDDFVAAAFAGQPPEPKVLWMTKANQSVAEAALGHPYKQLRIRYWRVADKTVWVLDEIGKDEDITIGFVLQQDAIIDTKVLAFRESRGWEIRFDAFVKQFFGTRLDASGELTQAVDNITGATLSVNAYRRLARFALQLHRLALQNHA